MNYYFSALLFYIALLTQLIIANQEREAVYILIHGTWAIEHGWHQSDGIFYQNLSNSIKIIKGKLITFNWSGKLNHECRLKAGKELAQLVCSYPETTEINIVAHSHGANVGILASQELAKQNKKNRIKKFYALGGPVDEKKYMPDMSVIEYYYNFFSMSDYVQPVLGFYARIFTHHERIANIRLYIDGKEPNHGDTHAPTVGYWLPFIHEELGRHKIGNFQHFTFGVTSPISFYQKKIPCYEIDQAIAINTLIDNTSITDIEQYYPNF